MKPAWIAVLFLLAGAVANVGVAWSYPLWPEPNRWETTPVGAADELWSKAAGPGWPPCEADGRRLRTAIITVEMRYTDVASPAAPAAGRFATGFPMRSVQAYVRFEGVGGAKRSVDHGLVVTSVPLIVLGYAPIGVGFAVDTIFYAALLWLLVCGPVALRGVIRARRGRCVSCGYDLRHTRPGPCPECGRESGAPPRPGTALAEAAVRLR